MDGHKLLTIVVPAYNSERHIEELVNSLRPLIIIDDVELIFVNDGSTDKTFSLIEDAKLKNKNISSICVNNGGQGRARNIGTSISRSKYIWYVDCDDRVDVKDASELISILRDHEFDLMIFGYKKRIVSENREELFTPKYSGGFINNKDIVSYDSFGHSAWNKIVKKEFIEKNDLLFLEGVIHEDMAVVPLWVSMSNRVFIYRKNIYEYYVHSSSSVHGNYNKDADFRRAISNLVEKGSRDPDRIGRSITKEIFFYTLPRWGGGVFKEISFVDYFVLYRRMISFYRFIPESYKRINHQNFGLIQRLYIKASREIGLIPFFAAKLMKYKFLLPIKN